MRARVSWVGRALLALILLLLKILWWPLRLLWRAAGRLGLWLRRLLGRLLGPPWRYLGRVGLAQRNLYNWFLWWPFKWSLGRGIVFLLALWRLAGRTGLAFRKLLTWFIWRPILFVTAPFRWFYRKFLHRPLFWLARLLWRIVSWPFRLIGRFLRNRWQATAARRWRWRRAWQSRLILLRARLRLRLRRPQPPITALLAPRQLLVERTVWRPSRMIASLLAFNIVLVGLGFILAQPNQPKSHIGYSRLPSDADEATPTPVVGSGEAAAPVATSTPLPPILLTPWPTPDYLGTGGSVVFTLRQNGNSDIYVLSVGRPEAIRFTNHPADDRDPAFSPDGRRLAFASHRDGNWEIYVLEVPTGNLIRVTNDPAFDGGPSWSNDGQWLVYESYQQSNLDLYLVRADGSNQPIRLTEHPAPDFSPAWSSGGRHIAFTSWRSGNKDIYLMPLDAASDETATNVTASPAGQEDNPSFSPDGRYLAYDDDSTGFELVYAVPLADYRPSGPPASLGQQGRHPTWSPDSSSLLYVHETDNQVFLVAGGVDAWSVAPQVYAGTGHLEDPAWSAVSLPRTLPDYLRQIAITAELPLYTEQIKEPAPGGPPYLLWQVPVNAPSPYLNDRVNESFLSLRERVAAEVGWDFLGQMDNVFEPVEGKPLPGQSDQTWNKAGRAFDIYFRYALADNPQLEVVREEMAYETYWRLYLRATAQDGTQGEPLRDLPWDFRARYGFEPQYYDQGGTWKEYLPPGYYVDFTALAADYGWSRVPAVESWHTYFPAIRFWHYENRQGLTWEQAMLEIYTAEEILAAFDEQ
jgi:TolB protein